MRLLGSGATRRAKSTLLPNNLAFARHPWVHAIRSDPRARCPVEACDKGLPLIPNEEARPVHGSIGEAPEWVRIIRQKVGRVQSLLARSDSLRAEGTVRPPSFDPIHDRRLPQHASRCLTDRAPAARLAECSLSNGLSEPYAERQGRVYVPAGKIAPILDKHFRVPYRHPQAKARRVSKVQTTGSKRPITAIMVSHMLPMRG